MGCLTPVIKKSLFIVLVWLLILAAVPLPAQASQDADVWSKHPIPRKGAAGGWVLTSNVTAEQTGVTAIAAAFDGTIYAATEEILGSPLNGYNLFKSTDGGYTWTPLWKIPTNDKPSGATITSKIIALVLPRWEYADTLYLATQYNVYTSTDGGENFTILGQPAYGSGANPTNSRLITSLAVTYYKGRYLALVGSRDADAGDYGGVYIYDKSNYPTPWTDLRVGVGAAGTKYDVLAVAFPPNFADDQQFVAVVTDETDTIVTTRLGAADWGTTIGDAYLLNPTSVPPFEPWAATGGSLAFPADYDSDVSEDKYIQYVGVNVGGVTGGVYMIMGAETPDDSMAIPVFASVPVYSLAAAGEAFGSDLVIGEGLPPATGGVFTPPAVVAGLTDGSVISIAAGVAYTPPSASPAENAVVALGGFHGSGYFVYAGTSGINGGFARSVDSGATFARTAFICDDLQTITDLAVSPIYDKDSTMYMITVGNSGNSILWRTANGGITWDAVLTEGQLIDTAMTVENFNEVVISPGFASDTTVFVGESGTAPNIWRSTDNGFRFAPLPTKTGTAGTIDSWAIVDNREVRVGDSLGDFYKTTNGGLNWSSPVATGIGASVESMVLSPDYDNDSTILVGGASTVYLSTDDGETWRQPSTSATGLTGAISVAFSPHYTDNSIIYAAGATGGGIRRLVTGEDKPWQRIDNISPGRIEITPAISALVVGDDGSGLSTVYGTDPSPMVTRVVTAGGGIAAEGGMARSLNPTDTLSPSADAPLFEIVNTNLPASATMSGLWLAEGAGSRRLWSYDSSAIPHVLYTYEDTLTMPLQLVSPADGASSGRQASSRVSWEEISSAKTYNLWYDIDPGFEMSPAQIYTPVAHAEIAPAGGLASGTTYYWRVRVGQSGGSTTVPGTTITFGAPALSRFSTTWSFTTGLAGGEWNPFRTAEGFVGNVVPTPGATDVPLKPNFQWNSADWANGYEFVLANNSAFANPIISRTGANALETTAYFSEKKLNYMTTYYWKVRAISKNSQSQWAVGIFTTEPAPSASAPPAPPAPPPASGTPMYIWGMLAIMVVLIIVLLILIMTTRRPISSRRG